MAGGGGFFGRTVVELLRARGLAPHVPERAELDVEDPSSLRRALRPRDLVVDAAGPFQARTPALVEAALELGADVVDLNESLPYARKLRALAPRIEASGSAVLSSCSAVSTVAFALVRESGLTRPVRVSALVSPAARETASAGTVRALLASVGARIEVWRGGRFVPRLGWREVRDFALPPRRGRLVESALSLDLPAVWPSLRDVDCWTDTGTPGASALLSLVARAPALRRLASAAVPLGIALARVAGRSDGAFAIEVADETGAGEALALAAARGSYRIAAAPAVLAAAALAPRQRVVPGLLPVDRHVSPGELLGYLGSLGVALERSAMPQRRQERG